MISMPIAFSRALPADRLRDIGVLAALLLWLAYTRIYWILQAAHLTAPPCPFYYLTGHPCPFCGGTRSFAYMWRGDIADAVRLYPLGPMLFAGTILGVGGLAFGAITGRTWTPRLTAMQWRLFWVGAVSALLVSWALKVFILGN
ncbi:MAG: DUF2752 domain-containing protein [Chloroflexi bacterium]|nr:MAG: DUF2752 domain-containing protein [Chloroflexota bacterium]TMF40368.1 MAG: DUF2752 domain-containing protein [Chloroflexota bacterium]